jgi:hypothetical protein
VALLFGTDVTPDQRGANDSSLFIEKDCAVHLAGETNAGNVSACVIRARQRFAHRKASGTPPIFRLLLGPANLWRSKWLVILGSCVDQAAIWIDDDRARAACADVNSQDVNKSPSRISG